VSVLARVLRQFHEDAETIILAKVLVLPDMPTMGARLDLRVEGVEDPLTVVGVTLRPVPDGPGLRPPSIDVLLLLGAAGRRGARPGWLLARQGASAARGARLAPCRRCPPDVAQEHSGSVRTPEGLSCPVCRTAPLRGRQTVCSPRCRAKRHRQRRAESRQAQIQDVKSLLQATLTKLEDA